MPNGKGSRARFGNIRKLPSGRFQARFTAPGSAQPSSAAPTTFDTRGDAETWLAMMRADIARDAWNPTANCKAGAIAFGAYADRVHLDRRAFNCLRLSHSL